MQKTDEIIEAMLDPECDWTALVEETEPGEIEEDQGPDFEDLVTGLLRGERLMAERRRARG